MISLTAEYSLRAILCLAAHGRSQTTHQIAAATRIPPWYLSKILQALRRAGMIDARHGINGGYALRRDPASLTLLQVVQVTDVSHRITTCPLGQNRCALHRRLDDAAAQVEDGLARQTVAQLMAPPDVPPKCPAPLAGIVPAATCLYCQMGESPCLR